MIERSLSGSRTFGSLSNRNFRLFFFGQLVSQAGTWMTRIAQTLLVLELANGSGTAVGVLAACQYGPVLLLSAWAGTVADRSDKRRLLFWVQAISMLQSLALGLAVAFGVATVAIIGALAALQGVLGTFDNPTRRTFVVELVALKQQNNALSLSNACMTSSRVFGPALGGLVSANLGFEWCFFIDAASYVAVLGAFLMMRTSEMRPAPLIQRAHGQVIDGLRSALHNRRLRAPLVMLGLVGTLAFNLPITVPLLVKGPLHGSDLTFSVMFSFLSLGSVGGSLFVARRFVIGDRHLIITSAAFGLALAGFAWSPNLPVAFVMAGLVGFASIAFISGAASAMQARSEPQYRGRTMAIFALLIMGTTPIGGPLLGITADSAGPRMAVLLGAIACFAAAGYGVVASKQPLQGSNVDGSPGDQNGDAFAVSHKRRGWAGFVGSRPRGR